MTGVLLRLKLTVLRNGLSGSRGRALWSLVALLGTVGGSVAGAIRLAAAASRPDVAATESLVVGTTVLFGLWVFGPLLLGGVDDALDPTRLVLLPLHRRDLRRGLLAGALIGVLPLATVITLAGLVWGWAPHTGPTGPVLVPLAAVVLLLLCLGTSRALAVALAFASRSRRGKDVAVLLASLGAAALFLGTQSIRFLGSDQRTRALEVLRLLPAGRIGAVLVDLRSGDAPIGAAATIAACGALAVVLLRLWVVGLDRLLVDPESIRHHRAARDERAIAVLPRMLRPLAAHPVAVMTAKELRYLVRSPQRRSSLIISIVIGTVFALLQSMRYSSANSLAVFGAPIAVLFGVHATNNLLGTDARSLWLEQCAGVRLRDQLVARGIAATPNVVVPTILAAGVLAVMTDGWSELALVSALSCTCWGLPLGIGSVISVIAPFNQPDVGNPYSNRRTDTGQSGLVSLMALVGIVSLLLVALPVAGVVGAAWEAGSAPAVIGTVAAGGMWSLLVWFAGVATATRIVRGREVDLLSRIGGRRAAT